MKVASAVILVLAAAVLVSAQSASVISASREKEAVVATLEGMWDAIAKADLDKYATYIHPEFTSFGENDVYLSSGKAAELRGYSEYLKTAKDVRTEMHQPEITVRGDVAWVAYYWTESSTVDGKRVTSRGKSTRIFVKEGGKWLCIHGHYTAVP